MEILERMFERTHYPDVLVREQIANMIQLTEEKVEVMIHPSIVSSYLTILDKTEDAELAEFCLGRDKNC